MIKGMKFMFLYLRPFVGRMRDDERGVTATEYGLILAFVAIVLIAGATLLGEALDGIFKDSATAVDSRPAP